MSKTFDVRSAFYNLSQGLKVRCIGWPDGGFIGFQGDALIDELGDDFSIDTTEEFGPVEWELYAEIKPKAQEFVISFNDDPKVVKAGEDLKEGDDVYYDHAKHVVLKVKPPRVAHLDADNGKCPSAEQRVAPQKSAHDGVIEQDGYCKKHGKFECTGEEDCFDYET